MTTASRRPFHRETPQRRRELARQCRGQVVRVTIQVSRSADGPEESFRGLVVAVATPWVGTVADLLILRDARGEDLAFSLATVASIEVDLATTASAKATAS